MITKSILIGIIIFMIDLLTYPKVINSVMDPKERRELVSRLKYTIPIGLFMQIFFALIFVFTFKYLAIFKALTSSVGGGLYFAYIMFLPMLYMLFNNLLWADSKRTMSYINIVVWGLKLTICGLFVPFI